jgi:predicted MPP superfamily phosphohydrolase
MGMTPIAMRRPLWGKRYLAGHYHVGPLQLYVNQGVGCVGLNLRIGCPPEVTDLTLRSPAT